MAASAIRSLCELPEYAQVLVNLVARDLKVKYARSALGFLWTLIYPALMLAIYMTVFGVVLRINIPVFWAYLVAGLIPFQFLSGAVVEGARAIRSNGNLIRKIHFPLEILVVATVTAKLVEFLLQLAVAVVFLILLHHDPASEVSLSLTKSAVVLPGAVLLLYVLALAIALPLAAWSVIYRDVDHIIALGMTAWFYLTPIFWSIGIAHRHIGSAVRWFALNPALNVIELFRAPLYAGDWPVNHALDGGGLSAWLVASAMCLGLLALGYYLFHRSRDILAEVV